MKTQKNKKVRVTFQATKNAKSYRLYCSPDYHGAPVSGMPGVVYNDLGQFERVDGTAPILENQRSGDETNVFLTKAEERMRTLEFRLAAAEYIMKKLDSWVRTPSPETPEEKRDRVTKLISKIWKTKPSSDNFFGLDRNVIFSKFGEGSDPVEATRSLAGRLATLNDMAQAGLLKSKKVKKRNKKTKKAKKRGNR